MIEVPWGSFLLVYYFLLCGHFRPLLDPIGQVGLLSIRFDPQTEAPFVLKRDSVDLVPCNVGQLCGGYPFLKDIAGRWWKWMLESTWTDYRYYWTSFFSCWVHCKTEGFRDDRPLGPVGVCRDVDSSTFGLPGGSRWIEHIWGWLSYSGASMWFVWFNLIQSNWIKFVSPALARSTKKCSRTD